MFKRILAITLCLLLVLSFAACKKDKTGGASSDITSSDATQDFDQDIWDEGSLTEEEKEELEDLWDKLKENANAEISTTPSSNSTSSSNSTPSSNSSSEESNSTGSSSSNSTSTPSKTPDSSDDDKGDLSGEISVEDKGFIW